MDNSNWIFLRRKDEDGNVYTVHSVQQRPIKDGREFRFDWSLELCGGTIFRATTRGTLDRTGKYGKDPNGYGVRWIDHDELGVVPEKMQGRVCALLLYCMDASVFMPTLCEEYVLATEVGIPNPFEDWSPAGTEVSE